MIEVAFLADHPDAIPSLAAWFRAQWPDYYAGRSQADVEQDMRAEARRDGLPVRLVALVDGEPAGTIVLRERALAALPDAHPGLGGLFVREACRGRGAGTALVRAGMKVASQQGHAVVYATTAAAGGILKRLGWEAVRMLTHEGERLTLYRATPMVLEFRRFQREHYPEYASWFADPELNRQLGPMDEAWLEAILSEPESAGQTWAVFRGTELVAVVETVFDPQNVLPAGITAVATKPALRRQGIATAALRHVLALHQGRGVVAHVAYVAAGNPAGRRCLEKAGFVPVAAAPNEQGYIELRWRPEAPGVS